MRIRIKLRIRLGIITLAPRIFWTHGSAAASAKRTEIRRAAPACMELPKAFGNVLLSKASASVSFL